MNTLSENRPSSDFRTLSNPPARLPLAPYLDYTADHSDPARLAGVLRRNVAACGDKIGNIERIAIAYPHKHPHNMRHINAANGHAERLKSEMELIFRHMSFPLATSIHETVHLGRSENQSVLHALTGKQVYAVDPAIQKDPLPFITTARGPREYFIIVDWVAVQATTAANLASFITHNGGTVLAVVTGNRDRRLAQSEEVIEGNEHLPMNLRMGIIPSLAAAFNRATGCKIPPGTCVEKVESALHPHGRSLRTLTAQEGETLLHAINSGALTFDGLLNGLNYRPYGSPIAPSPVRPQPYPYNIYGG